MTLGAATTDIIVQYVSTIKALREMDASGVLLEAIADPIREYLRSRKVSTCCSGWRESRLAVATAGMATRTLLAGKFLPHQRKSCCNAGHHSVHRDHAHR